MLLSNTSRTIYPLIYGPILVVIDHYFTSFQSFSTVSHGKAMTMKYIENIKNIYKITFFLSKTKLKLMFGKVKRYDKLDFTSGYVYFGMNPSTHQNRVIFKWFSIQNMRVFNQKIHEYSKNLIGKKIMNTKQD